MVPSLDLLKGLVLLLLLVLLCMFSQFGAQNRDVVATTLPSAGAGLSANGELSLSGRGEPGSQVEVLVDDEVVGTTQVADDGSWSFSTTLDNPSASEVKVQTRDADGQVMTTSEAIPLNEGNSLPADNGSESETLVNQAPDEGSDNPAAQESDNQESDNPAQAQESDNPAQAEGSDNPAQAEGSDNPAQAQESDNPAQAQESDNPAQAEGSDKPAQAEGSDNPAPADGSDNPAQAEGSDNSAQSETTTNGAGSKIILPPLLFSGVDLAGNEVTFIGTSTLGTQIEVLIDNEMVGQTQIESDGTWALTTQLDRSREIEVQVLAIDGNEQIESVSDRLFLKLATSATEIDLPILLLPTTGSQLTPGEVTFFGIGQPAAEMALVLNGEVLAQTQIEDSGSWSLITELNQPGQIAVQLRMKDPNGQLFAVTEHILITVSASE